MYRAMQNPDTPNLPFAQSLLPTMYRDMENEDTPNLPFAQGRPSKYVYYNYIVNGDHWTFGKMVNKKVRWTESNAQQYRAKGYSVVKESDTPLDALGREQETTTTNGNDYSKSIKEQFDRLFRIHKQQEYRITAGYEHRVGI